MSKGKRDSYTSQFKFQVAIEAIKRVRTLTQLASGFYVHPFQTPRSRLCSRTNRGLAHTPFLEGHGRLGEDFEVKTKMGHESLYLFGAVTPAAGELFTRQYEKSNTEAMKDFLLKLSAAKQDKFSIVILNRASWHTTEKVECLHDKCERQAGAGTNPKGGTTCNREHGDEIPAEVQ